MNTLNNFIFPIVVGIILSIFSVIFNKLIKKSEKRLKTPTLQTYKLTKNNTKQQYSKEILNCNFKYILIYKNYSDNEKNNETDNVIHYQPIFISVDNKKCANFLKKENIFAMCFYNKIENTVLNISSMNMANSEFRLINDETMLSALKYNSSVCILCDINDIPKNFSGSFNQGGISYNITESETSTVIPKFKMKTNNRN